MASVRCGRAVVQDLPRPAAAGNFLRVNEALRAGRTAVREERWRDAEQIFLRCARVEPSCAAAHFWLGNVYRRLGNHRAAIGAYTQASQQDPGSPAPLFNLGLSRMAIGEMNEAGQAFVSAAQRSGSTMDAEAHQLAIECALALSEKPAPALPKRTEFVAARDEIALSVVCCSISPHKISALRANLAQVFMGCRWELILIDDARSLCEAYQRGVARCGGDIVIFCHDDIEILSANAYELLVDALTGADLVGVAGTTLVNGPAVGWSGYPNCHGWVTQFAPGGGLLPTPMSLHAPRVDNAQALDGLFFAAHRSIFKHMQFDARTFDGFHFYDLDFTYRAYLAGLRLRIQCDILLTHQSWGNFDAEYMRYAAKFAQKFPAVGMAAQRAPVTFRTCAPSVSAVRHLFGWLRHWASGA